MFSALSLSLFPIYCLYSNSSSLPFSPFFKFFVVSSGPSQIFKPLWCINSCFFFCGGGSHQKWYISLPCTSQMAFHNSVLCITLTDGSFPVLLSFCQGTGRNLYSSLFHILQSSVNCNVFHRNMNTLVVSTTSGSLLSSFRNQPKLSKSLLLSLVGRCVPFFCP